MKVRVLSLVNDAHPPAAKFFQNVKVGDSLANQDWGRLHDAVILGNCPKRVFKPSWTYRKEAYDCQNEQATQHECQEFGAAPSDGSSF